MSYRHQTNRLEAQRVMIARIAGRVPAILRDKFGGRLDAPSLNLAGLTLAQDGALRRHESRHGLHKETAVLRAIELAVRQELITFHRQGASVTLALPEGHESRQDVAERYETGWSRLTGKCFAQLKAWNEPVA